MILLLTNAKPYSPITTLSATFLTAATTATVTAVTVFPTAPFYAVITSAANLNFSSNDSNDYETILVEGISGSNLTTITRGIEGLAQDWASGDYIAGFFTAAAFDDLWSDKLDKSGGTMTGQLNCADQLLTRPLIKDYAETAVIATGVTGATAINLENGNYIKHTLSGDVVYTDNNAAVSGRSCSFTLQVVQPSTLHAITWFAGITWAAGEAPTMTINKKYLMVFTTDDAGDTWLGALVGEF